MTAARRPLVEALRELRKIVAEVDEGRASFHWIDHAFDAIDAAIATAEETK